MGKPWWQPQERQVFTLGRAAVSVSFEPRDVWVGVFWDRRDGLTQVFVCLVPCLPVRVVWKGSN